MTDGMNPNPDEVVEAVARAERPQYGASEERLHLPGEASLGKTGDAVRAVVRSAWNLCDDAEWRANDSYLVDARPLMAALRTLEDLIPQDEQPASAAHAITLWWLPSPLAALPPPTSAALSGGGRRPTSDVPYACHVLAARFYDCEWIYEVVLSPPSTPFTHWWPLPDPHAQPPNAPSIGDGDLKARIEELEAALREIIEYGTGFSAGYVSGEAQIARAVLPPQGGHHG